MVTFELLTIAGWIWELFLNIFGDPILAGIVGYILLIVFGIRMGLGFDGLIVLGIFSAVLFSRFLFPIDLSILFVIGISVSIVSLAALRLMHH